MWSAWVSVKRPPVRGSPDSAWLKVAAPSGGGGLVKVQQGEIPEGMSGSLVLDHGPCGSAGWSRHRATLRRTVAAGSSPSLSLPGPSARPSSRTAPVMAQHRPGGWRQPGMRSSRGACSVRSLRCGCLTRLPTRPRRGGWTRGTGPPASRNAPNCSTCSPGPPMTIRQRRSRS